MTDPTTPVSHTYAAFFPDQESAETCAEELAEKLPCVVSNVVLTDEASGVEVDVVDRAARDGRHWLLRVAMITKLGEGSDEPDFFASDTDESAELELVVVQHGGLVYAIDSEWTEDKESDT